MVFLNDEHACGNDGMIRDATPRPDNLYLVLRQAIQVERDGHMHYVEAARRTEYLPARRVFLRMAADEDTHRNLLEATYAAYRNQGERGSLPGFERPPESAPLQPSPIFSPEFLKECRDPHSERSAISIGIILERNSSDFYQALLNQAAYMELRALLRFLVFWENSHLEFLSEELRHLDAYSGFDTLFRPPRDEEPKL